MSSSSSGVDLKLQSVPSLIGTVGGREQPQEGRKWYKESEIEVANIVEVLSPTPTPMPLVPPQLSPLEQYREAMTADPKMSKRKQAQLLVRLGMSVAEAAQIIGIRYQQAYHATEKIRSEILIARCKICGRPLSDPGHIGDGVGPVCALRQSMQGKNLKRR